MALSAKFINNMQSAKENVQTYNGKNVRKNKRCRDSSDEENFNLNVKRAKTSSGKHIHSNEKTNLASTNKHLSTVPEPKPKLSTCHCSFSSNKKKNIKMHKLFGCETPTKDPLPKKITKCKREIRIQNRINKLFGGTPIKPKNRANCLSTSNSLSTGITTKHKSSEKHPFSTKDKSSEKHPSSTKDKSSDKHHSSTKDKSSEKHNSSTKAKSSEKSHSSTKNKKSAKELKPINHNTSNSFGDSIDCNQQGLLPPPSISPEHQNPKPIKRTVKEIIIQLLAVRDYNKFELYFEISRYLKIISDLSSLSTVVSQIYQSQKDFWGEVKEDWPFYTEEEKAIVKQNKTQHMLLHHSSPKDKASENHHSLINDKSSKKHHSSTKDKSSEKQHSSNKNKSSEKHPVPSKNTSPEKHTGSSKDPFSFISKDKLWEILAYFP